jgi:hypothetical protein
LRQLPLELVHQIPLEIMNVQLKTTFVSELARALQENPTDARDGALRYGLAKALGKFDFRKMDEVGTSKRPASRNVPPKSIFRLLDHIPNSGHL